MLLRGPVPPEPLPIAKSSCPGKNYGRPFTKGARMVQIAFVPGLMGHPSDRAVLPWGSWVVIVTKLSFLGSWGSLVMELSSLGFRGAPVTQLSSLCSCARSL